MNSVSVPRAITGAGVFLTAAIVSLFFTPEQISQVDVVTSPTYTHHLESGNSNAGVLPTLSLESQKSLEETRHRVDEQKHVINELESKTFDLMSELKKVNLLLEKERSLNARTKNPESAADIARRDHVRKPKPKVPSNDWLTPLISKVSKRGLTFGWIMDILNAITGYTIALMVLRNIWDYFNPETQEDPEAMRKKLGQQARSASYRGSIKKNSLRGDYPSDPRKSSLKGEFQSIDFGTQSSNA